MNNRVRYKTFDQLSFADILVYSKLPEHPFWSHIETKIDFSFADRLCSVLYSGRGQYPYAPSLKLKVHLVQTYYNLSDRQVEEKIIGDLFIKRFLGLPVDFFGFDHSTIGLDRSRMGASMFQACHLYILAQMYSLGLWGDGDERWIIDSFPTNVGLPKISASRLIQQGMIRILQHLKRTNHDLFQLTKQSVALDAIGFRLPPQPSESDRMLAFSKLVAQAYGLLQWFELEDVVLIFNHGSNIKARQTSSELQDILRRILTENSRLVEPDTDDAPHSDNDQGGDGSSHVQYEKIPLSSRSSDRIASAFVPDARVGMKNKSTVIKGYKTQNLCTNNSVILNTSVIPGNEHDRDAMVDMVKDIRTFFGTTPAAVLGDTAYGHGKQRDALASLNIPVIAPVITTQNPKGLYDISKFTYDPAQDQYICPNDKRTFRKYHNTGLEGFQYYFAKADCESCPLKKECTSNIHGRRVFQSDYYHYYEDAKAFNETDSGIAAFAERWTVERKNQELKNNCGLGQPKARGNTALSIKATLAGIVVNLKHTLRRLIAPSPGFVRRCKVSN